MDREKNDLNPETADEVLADEKRQRAIQIMKDTKKTICQRRFSRHSPFLGRSSGSRR